MPENKNNLESPKDGKHTEKIANPPTIIFAGFAKLPANASMQNIPGVLAVEIEVDPYDMRIADVACSCLPALGAKFITSLLVGEKIDNGLENIMKEIRERYISTTQRAMIAAIEDAFKRYMEYKNKTGDIG